MSQVDQQTVYILIVFFIVCGICTIGSLGFLTCWYQRRDEKVYVDDPSQRGDSIPDNDHRPSNPASVDKDAKAHDGRDVESGKPHQPYTSQSNQNNNSRRGSRTNGILGTVEDMLFHAQLVEQANIDQWYQDQQQHSHEHSPEGDEEDNISPSNNSSTKGKFHRSLPQPAIAPDILQAQHLLHLHHPSTRTNSTEEGKMLHSIAQLSPIDNLPLLNLHPSTKSSRVPSAAPSPTHTGRRTSRPPSPSLARGSLAVDALDGSAKKVPHQQINNSPAQNLYVSNNTANTRTHTPLQQRPYHRRHSLDTLTSLSYIQPYNPHAIVAVARAEPSQVAAVVAANASIPSIAQNLPFLTGTKPDITGTNAAKVHTGNHQFSGGGDASMEEYVLEMQRVAKEQRLQMLLHSPGMQAYNNYTQLHHQPQQQQSAAQGVRNYNAFLAPLGGNPITGTTTTPSSGPNPTGKNNNVANGSNTNSAAAASAAHHKNSTQGLPSSDDVLIKRKRRRRISF